MAKWTGDGFQSDARTTDIAPRSPTLVTEQPYASATGVKRDPASLTFKLWGPAGASTAEGRVRVTRASALVAALGAYPGAPGTYGCLWLGPGSTETNGATAALFADGSANTYLNVAAGGTVGLAIGGGDVVAVTASLVAVTPATIRWKKATSAPQLAQEARTTDEATSALTLTPQAPWASATGANRTPGSLIVALAAPTNSGTTVGGLKVTHDGSLQAQIGAYNHPATYSAVWLGPGIVPSSNNFAFLSNGTSLSYLNVPSGGTVYVAIGGSSTTSLGVSASAVELSSIATLRWTEGVSSPTITQAIRGSDAAAQDLEISAQAAQLAASTHKVGGNLILRGGAKATAGTAAETGFVRLATGQGAAVLDAGYFDASICTKHWGPAAWDQSVQPVLTQFQRVGDNGTAVFEIGAQAASSTATGTNENGGRVWIHGGARDGSGNDGGVRLGTGGGNVVVEVAASGTASRLAFFGVTPVARPVVATGTGKTVDNVITELQNLGLFSQT